jgi:hypothetical protein
MQSDAKWGRVLNLAFEDEKGGIKHKWDVDELVDFSFEFPSGYVIVS